MNIDSDEVACFLRHSVYTAVIHENINVQKAICK